MAKTVLLTNPRSRKAPKRKTSAKRKTRTVAKRKGPSIRRRRSVTKVRARRRRNPAKRGIIDTTIMPAAKGAAGAIAIDTIYNLIPIPAEYQSGLVGSLVKMAGVIGIGMAAEKTKLVKPAMTRDAVNGALTVQIYNMGQELVGSMLAGGAPAADSGVGYIASAQNAGQLGFVTDAPNFNASQGLGMFNQFEEQEYTY